MFSKCTEDKNAPSLLENRHDAFSPYKIRCALLTTTKTYLKMCVDRGAVVVAASEALVGCLRPGLEAVAGCDCWPRGNVKRGPRRLKPGGVDWALGHWLLHQPGFGLAGLGCGLDDPRPRRPLRLPLPPA